VHCDCPSTPPEYSASTGAVVDSTIEARDTTDVVTVVEVGDLSTPVFGEPSTHAVAGKQSAVAAAISRVVIPM